MFDYKFIVCALRSECITSASIYILSEHHLPLGADWPCAGEYGGCTS